MSGFGTFSGRRTPKAFATASALAILGAAFAQTPAFAQDAPVEEGFDDLQIVITAQRRETLLQETPVAVSAFSEGTLESLSVANVGDVIAFVPNVSSTSGPSGGNDGFFFVRGIGQVDSNPAGDPGVAVYIDDVYMGRIQGSSFDSLDIERIEVLRGPQGTLYGRNTIGGAVNVITSDPGDTFETRVRAVAGERERRDLFASVDLPVSDAAGFKVSAFSRHQDGWGENVYTGATYGDVDTIGGRIVGVFEPGDKLSFRLVADATKADGSPPQTILLAFNPTAGAPPGGASPLAVPFIADMGNERSSDPFLNFASTPPINELDSSGLALTTTWNGDAVTVKSITAYRQVSQYIFNDFDGGAYSFYDNFFDTDQEQLSQELQFSGEAMGGNLDWLVGAFYFDEKINHNNGICLGTNIGIPGVGAKFDRRCLLNNQRYSLDITSWAGFGNFSYALTDRFSVDLGLRYTYEEKAQNYNFLLDNTDNIANFAGIPPIAIPSLRLNVSDDWESFTPRVGVNYKVTDDVFLYASFAEGFKSGGFDGRPTTAPGAPPPSSYDPETIDTVEAGVKTQMFDDRVRFNVAGFFSDYKDIQLLVIDPGSGFFILTNAGDAEIRGVEAEFSFVPTSRFRLDASVGYIDHEYTELSPSAAPSGITLDDKLPLTPEWTANVGAEYTHPMGDVGELRLRADYSYRSEVSYGAPNGPFELQDGFGLLNLRATLSSQSERVQFSVFGKNVTDEYYISNAQDVVGALGVAFAQVGQPSEWGAELSLRF